MLLKYSALIIIFVKIPIKPTPNPNIKHFIVTINYYYLFDILTSSYSYSSQNDL